MASTSADVDNVLWLSLACTCVILQGSQYPNIGKVETHDAEWCEWCWAIQPRTVFLVTRGGQLDSLANSVTFIKVTLLERRCCWATSCLKCRRKIGPWSEDYKRKHILSRSTFCPTKVSQFKQKYVDGVDMADTLSNCILCAKFLVLVKMWSTSSEGCVLKTKNSNFPGGAPMPQLQAHICYSLSKCGCPRYTNSSSQRTFQLRLKGLEGRSPSLFFKCTH